MIARRTLLTSHMPVPATPSTGLIHLLVSHLCFPCVAGDTGVPGWQQGPGEGPGRQGPLRERSYEEVARKRLSEDIHSAQQQRQSPPGAHSKPSSRLYMNRTSQPRTCCPLRLSAERSSVHDVVPTGFMSCQHIIILLSSFTNGDMCFEVRFGTSAIGFGSPPSLSDHHNHVLTVL